MMSKSGWGHGVWGTGLRYQKDYLVDGHGDRTIDCSRPFDAAADVRGGAAAVLIVLAVPARAAGFSFCFRVCAALLQVMLVHRPEASPHSRADAPSHPRYPEFATNASTFRIVFMKLPQYSA